MGAFLVATGCFAVVIVGATTTGSSKDCGGGAVTGSGLETFNWSALKLRFLRTMGAGADVAITYSSKVLLSEFQTRRYGG